MRYMKKLLIISVIINIILLAGLFYITFDMGILKSQIRVGEIEKQTVINTNSIQQIVGFINSQVQNLLIVYIFKVIQFILRN